MDFNELELNEDYHSKQLAQKNIIHTIDTLEINQLYPEFEFSSTYGLHSNDLALDKHLITFEQVILNIIPLDKKETFQNFYGITFETFIEFVKIGKILPVICYPYQNFPKFYEELFKIKTFPRSGRLRTFFEQKNNKDKQWIIDKIEYLVKSNNFEQNINKYFSSYNGNKIDLFINSFSSDIYDFYLLNMNEIVEIIFDIATIDPLLSHEVAIDYCNLLVRPLFDNLGGINTFTDKHLLKAEKLYLKNEKINFLQKNKKPTRKLVRKIESFIGINPSELVQFLDTEIILKTPISIEDKIFFSSEIEKDNLIKEFRSQLSTIQKNNLNKNSIQELSNISKEVSLLLKKDAKKLHIASEWATDTILLGAILPSLAGQVVFEKSLMNLLYSTIYPAFIGTKYDSIKKFSRNITGSLYEKLLQKPMTTAYWKSQQNKKS